MCNIAFKKKYELVNWLSQNKNANYTDCFWITSITIDYLKKDDWQSLFQNKSIAEINLWAFGQILDWNALNEAMEKALAYGYMCDEFIWEAYKWNFPRGQPFINLFMDKMAELGILQTNNVQITKINFDDSAMQIEWGPSWSFKREIIISSEEWEKMYNERKNKN